VAIGLHFGEFASLERIQEESVVYSLEWVENRNTCQVGCVLGVPLEMAGPDRVVDPLRLAILEFGIRGSSPTLYRVRTLGYLKSVCVRLVPFPWVAVRGVKVCWNRYREVCFRAVPVEWVVPDRVGGGPPLPILGYEVGAQSLTLCRLRSLVH
jgi:hypothetical protein